MKKFTITLFALFICIITIQAQDQSKSLSNNLGFGFHLTQFQKDLGLGINITSPYFGHERIAVRLRGNLMFNENIQNSTITWSPYSNLSLGLIGVSGMVGEYIRLYGEGGVLGLLPSDDFSSQDFVFGGYGVFGFEFFANNKFNYFIEIGCVGTGAKADKIVSDPIYSNGLLINVGFRFN